MPSNKPLQNPLPPKDSETFWLNNTEALHRIAVFADLSEGFTVGFVEVNLEHDRDAAILFLKSRYNEVQWVDLKFDQPALPYLIHEITQALGKLKLKPDQKIVLLLSGLEKAIGGYGDYPSLLSNMNIARDTYTRKLPYPMLFFLPSYALTRFARFAPDFWAWKSTEIRLKSDLPESAAIISELQAIPYYNRRTPVTPEHFDLLYRLLAENPQPTLSRADILDQLGKAYESCTQYTKAEMAYKDALKLYESSHNFLGEATSLNNLGSLYYFMGRYSEAEPLYERSLQIRETHLGADLPDTAQSLNNLAILYYSMGRYSEAEPLFVRSLQIIETQLGADHPDTATRLNNLAFLYNSMGRYSEAEPLYVRSLHIRETQLGADHPDTAQGLNNLGLLYESMGRYSEAEPLYGRSLHIYEAQLGADHPNTATSLNNLAELYRSMGRYSDAEPLYGRSLHIRETQLGADHPDTAQSLFNLAALYHNMQRHTEALNAINRAVEIYNHILGSDHPTTQNAYSWLQGIRAANPT